MSRSTILRRVSLLAFALLLGGSFVPRIAPLVHAQDDGDDEGEGNGPNLSEEQKKELQAISKLEKKANEAIQAEDYEAGAKTFKKLCEKLDKATLPEKMVGPARLNAHYNYACCLSRTSVKDEAVKEFDRSVQLGFFDWKHIAEDKDLDNVRDMDDFKKAVENGKKLETDKLVAQVKSGAPPFKFELDATGADGKKVSLDAYKGKVLVLTFINGQAEEASPELLVLQKASDDLKDKGVEVLGVVVNADKDALKEIADKNKIKFTLVTSEITDSIKNAIRGTSSAMPTGTAVLIIDKSGKVRAAASAIYQADAVAGAVKPLLDDSGSNDSKKDDKKPEKKDEKKDF